MAAARRISESERWVRAGSWEMSFHPMYWLGAEVHGATLGIVGLGQIGLEMAKRGLGLDMKVIYYSRTRKPELEEQFGLEYVEPGRAIGHGLEKVRSIARSFDFDFLFPSVAIDQGRERRIHVGSQLRSLQIV